MHSTQRSAQLLMGLCLQWEYLSETDEQDLAHNKDLLFHNNGLMAILLLILMGEGASSVYYNIIIIIMVLKSCFKKYTCSRIFPRNT